jgi:hypothetical protein
MYSDHCKLATARFDVSSLRDLELGLGTAHADGPRVLARGDCGKGLVQDLKISSRRSLPVAAALTIQWSPTFLA